MPLSAPPSSYTAAVERYLTGAGIAKCSARIYRISLTTWGWMLAGAPAPTGSARRGANPPVFPLTAIDDPALPEVLAELAAARADEMDADTVNWELLIARKAIGRGQRQGWIEGDPTIGIERRPAPPDRTKALAKNRIVALWRLDAALRGRTFWKMRYESAARADEVLCLNAEDLYPQDKRGRITAKGGATEGIHWQSGTAQLLPRLIARRTVARCSSPTARPRPGRQRWTCAPRPAGPVCRIAGLRRSSRGRPGCWPTRSPHPRTSRTWTAGPCTGCGIPRSPTTRRAALPPPMLLARSRHASVRSLERYARPGVDAVARYVAELDPAARCRT
ncbi:site-specific recombinase [Streptomyces sp. CT34]|uniref:site-specific recombinase n=1 Tax=Streptomyces sp. CT34 TaxID=1553907 RepID=UPI001F517756|nr:site-specific recombinase [Streptomyces sp. CT34]